MDGSDDENIMLDLHEANMGLPGKEESSGGSGRLYQPEVPLDSDTVVISEDIPPTEILDQEMHNVSVYIAFLSVRPTATSPVVLNARFFFSLPGSRGRF